MKRRFSFIIFCIILLFLTSCTGLNSGRLENFLDKTELLYNDEYGIKFDTMHSTVYSSGYITDNSRLIEVYIFWNTTLMDFGIYDLNSIENEINSVEDFYNFLDTVEAKEKLLLFGDIVFEDNTIILTNFEGEYYKDADRIVLFSK